MYKIDGIEINKSHFICIIPARGGSKGIPNKNIIDIKNAVKKYILFNFLFFICPLFIVY